MALNNEQFVTAMYITVLGRAPEAGTSSYPIVYTNGLNSGDINRSDVGYSFSRSEEALVAYGYYEKIYKNIPVSTTDPEFDRALKRFYWNAFNRLPATEGYTYWKSEVETENIQPYELPVLIIEGAQDNPEESMDRTTLDNKIELGIYFWQQFTERIGVSTSVIYYDMLISVIQGVTGTTNISRAKALIDRAITDWPRSVSNYEETEYNNMFNDLKIINEWIL